MEKEDKKSCKVRSVNINFYPYTMASHVSIIAAKRMMLQAEGDPHRDSEFKAYTALTPWSFAIAKLANSRS